MYILSPKKPTLPAQVQADVSKDINRRLFAYEYLFVQMLVEEGLTVLYDPKEGVCHFDLNGQTFTKTDFAFPFNTASASTLAQDKVRSRLFLEAAGIPVPDTIVVLPMDIKLGTWKENVLNMKFPVVVKPAADTKGGEGITLGIATMEDLAQDLLSRKRHNKGYIVETFLDGLKDYRVMMLDGQVLGVTEKQPPRVVGDGKHTIAELVVEENKVRAKLLGTDFFGIKIRRKNVQKTLASLKLTESSVPSKGKEIILSQVRNLTNGGRPVVITKPLPDAVVSVCQKTMKALNLRHAGIDILAKNILSKEFSGYVLEANYDPGFFLHCQGDKKKWRALYGKMIATLKKDAQR